MKYKRFKLNAISAEGLKQKEMNAIVGGTRICTCSCYWADKGGSSSVDNQNANFALGDKGGESTQGCNQYLSWYGQYSSYIYEAMA